MTEVATDAAPEAELILPDEPLLPIYPQDLPADAGILTPRDYQVECVRRVFECLQSCRSVLVVMATGTGKTVVAADIALRWPDAGRVLFIAHRCELIDQGAGTIGAHLDEECGIEMGTLSESRRGRRLGGSSRVLVASVQTVSRTNRLRGLDPNDFGLVIFDECHHCQADTWKKVLGWFQQNRQCRFLGITATPDRADKVLLGEVFEETAFTMDILNGIEEGWLVPIHQRYVVVEGLDFSQCRTVAGDLNAQDLARAMGADDDSEDEDAEARREHQKMLHAVADPTIREANGRQGIVFCVNIDHAERMAVVFRGYGVTAECVTKRTPNEMRKHHITEFKAGRLQFLVGCAVFTEGFDAPTASVIAVARPTKSRSLYTQCVGRGTRPDPEAVKFATPEERREAIARSSKPCCTVLDFVGNSGRHALISTADILGDKYPADLRAQVIAAMRTSAVAADIQEELAKAKQRREELARIKAEKKERERQAAAKRLEELRKRHAEEERLKQQAKAKYTTREVDPFGGRAQFLQGITEAPGGCSEKQAKFLEALGIPYKTAIRYTSRQASSVINQRRALSGAKYRVTIGKHRGQSLAEAGSGFIWWVRKMFEPRDQRGHELKRELLRNIEIMECERQATQAAVADDSEPPF
ncbi:MAG: DEAD/DEAH box helicase [Acidiferrobacteraceae bacterium]